MNELNTKYLTMITDDEINEFAAKTRNIIDKRLGKNYKFYFDRDYEHGVLSSITIYYHYDRIYYKEFAFNAFDCLYCYSEQHDVDKEMKARMAE